MHAATTTANMAGTGDSALPLAHPHAPLALPQGLVSRIDPVQLRMDHAAIELWLAARCDDYEAPHGAFGNRPNHTRRVYRKEAERFLLWLAVRGRSLADTSLQDCLAFRQFLADPQPAFLWCGPRGAPRCTVGWRPFEGPLGSTARHQAITVLKGMFGFLRDQQYLLGNPWSGVRKPRAPDTPFDAHRGFSPEQWQLVLDRLAGSGANASRRQLSWTIRFLRATGLRLAEAVGMDCGAFFRVEVGRSGDQKTNGELTAFSDAWCVSVMGKGAKVREVPVPSSLVVELGALLAERGGCRDLPQNGARPVLVRFAKAASRVDEIDRLSDQALYRQVKAFFRGIAADLETEGEAADARQFAAASTHWLRHTCATHSVSAGVALDVVRENLGHSSLAVTSIYARARLDRRIVESRRLT